MDPMPVGAVVPQFYGYYVPDKSCENLRKKSPILLLEYCGVQAKMSDLTLEQRRESWSLLERLHMNNYIHNSVYERNILVQSGPVQWSPFKRSKLHPRFRLIDFSRTTPCDHEHDMKSNFHYELKYADWEFQLGFFPRPGSKN